MKGTTGRAHSSSCKLFDLDEFIDKARATISEQWEVSGLMYEIPRLLLAQGLITKMACRRIYLGGINDFTKAVALGYMLASKLCGTRRSKHKTGGRVTSDMGIGRTWNLVTSQYLRYL
jgi:hypothetical protein